GRYDDLTGIFGLKDMSGVGISFGLDRIYLVLEELGLFPDDVSVTPAALFLNFGDAEALYAMKAISSLRSHGIRCELYPDNSKTAKQFQHADKRGIRFAVLCGSDEVAKGVFTVKDLASGEQEEMQIDGLIKKLII